VKVGKRVPKEQKFNQELTVSTPNHAANAIVRSLPRSITGAMSSNNHKYGSAKHPIRP